MQPTTLLLITAVSASTALADIGYFEYNIGVQSERRSYDSQGLNDLFHPFENDISGSGTSFDEEFWGYEPNGGRISAMGDSQGILYDGELRTHATYSGNPFNEEYSDGFMFAYFSVTFTLNESTDFMFESTLFGDDTGDVNFEISDDAHNVYVSGTENSFSSSFSLGPGTYELAVFTGSEARHDTPGTEVTNISRAIVSLNVVPAPGTLALLPFGLFACTRRRR